MKIRLTLTLVIITSILNAQNGFDLKLYCGFGNPIFVDNSPNKNLGRNLNNSLSMYLNVKLQYKIKDKEQAFLHLKFNRLTDVDVNLNNLRFPMDVVAGSLATTSKYKSKSSLSYISIGLGKSFSLREKLTASASFNVINHLDNLVSGLFTYGWDGSTEKRIGSYDKTNYSISLGLDYYIYKNIMLNLGVNYFLKQYQLDALFGKYRRIDTNLGIGYDF